MQAEAGKWYAIKEVAEIMNISRVTVWKHRRTGEMPARSFGGRMKVPGTWIHAKLSWNQPTYAIGL